MPRDLAAKLWARRYKPSEALLITLILVLSAAFFVIENVGRASIEASDSHYPRCSLTGIKCPKEFIFNPQR